MTIHLLALVRHWNPNTYMTPHSPGLVKNCNSKHTYMTTHSPGLVKHYNPSTHI